VLKKEEEAGIAVERIKLRRLKQFETEFK